MPRHLFYRMLSDYRLLSFEGYRGKEYIHYVYCEDEACEISDTELQYMTKEKLEEVLVGLVLRVRMRG